MPQGVSGHEEQASTSTSHQPTRLAARRPTVTRAAPPRHGMALLLHPPTCRSSIWNMASDVDRVDSAGDAPGCPPGACSMTDARRQARARAAARGGQRDRATMPGAAWPRRPRSMGLVRMLCCALLHPPASPSPCAKPASRMADAHGVRMRRPSSLAQPPHLQLRSRRGVERDGDHRGASPVPRARGSARPALGRLAVGHVQVVVRVVAACRALVVEQQLLSRAARRVGSRSCSSNRERPPQSCREHV